MTTKFDWIGSKNKISPSPAFWLDTALWWYNNKTEQDGAKKFVCGGGGNTSHKSRNCFEHTLNCYTVTCRYGAHAYCQKENTNGALATPKLLPAREAVAVFRTRFYSQSVTTVWIGIAKRLWQWSNGTINTGYNTVHQRIFT